MSEEKENSEILSRRKFLTAAASLVATSCLPSWAVAGELNRFAGSSAISPAITPQTNDSFWSRPRVLKLQRLQNNERVDVSYWRDGKIDVDGYNRVCWLMRDLRAGQQARMDPRLFDLLCAMQAWISYYGYSRPFIVSSGYRNPNTNAHTEGAAKNSMHMRGRAVDIIIPDLPVSYLGKLAQHYAAGGVGFYPDRGFIHVDTGNIRSWVTRGKRK